MDIHRENILIVDDTPDNLRLLSAILSAKGFEVRKSLSGRGAIASAQAVAPHLVLLDIRMPEMSGYDVCQELKADPRTQHIPVIFISALDDVFDKVKAFSAGGVDYITKPFQEVEVLARVENQLKIQRLQAKLVQQQQDLVRSHRDLEQLTEILSHQLQQPLHKVTGYAQLLIPEANHLSEITRDYPNRIAQLGHQMQRLIANWLTYSQLHQQPMPVERVDLNYLLSEAVERLQGAIATSHAQVTHDPLPTVMGNAAYLADLLYHLLDNAIQFAQLGVLPRIHISAQLKENEWVLSICDNGVGIEPQTLKGLFEEWQPILNKSDCSLGGLGLPICKRIIDLHQGQIWVESQPGAGTTIYFTLATHLAIAL